MLQLWVSDLWFAASRACWNWSKRSKIVAKWSKRKSLKIKYARDKGASWRKETIYSGCLADYSRGWVIRSYNWTKAKTWLFFHQCRHLPAKSPKTGSCTGGCKQGLTMSRKMWKNAIHWSANFCCHCHGQFGTAQPNAKLRNFRISDTQLTWARWKILQYPSRSFYFTCANELGLMSFRAWRIRINELFSLHGGTAAQLTVANPMAPWQTSGDGMNSATIRHPFNHGTGGHWGWFLTGFIWMFNGLKQLKTCLSFSNWPDTIWLQTSVAACSSSPCRSIDRGLALMSIIEGYGSKKKNPTKHTGVRTLFFFCHRSKKLQPLWHPEGWACNEGWRRRWSTWSC